jgi:hypothetical protein
MPPVCIGETADHEVWSLLRHLYVLWSLFCRKVLPGELASVSVARICRESVRGLIMCKYWVHMYVNGKMRPAATIAGIQKRGIKENEKGDEFNFDIW